MRLILIPVLILSLFSMGCNAFGTTDSPGDARDQRNAGIVKANEGECGTARNILIGIQNPDDDALAALGWAQLCISGATTANITASLFKFTTSSTDLTIVGILARTMLPMTTAKLNETINATGNFNNMRDVRTRNLELAIAKIVHASAIIANRSGNGGDTAKLEQDDIAPAACTAVDSACAGAAGVCTAGMSNSDVSEVITLLSEASANLSTAGATDLKALSDAIVSGLGAGGDAGRCFIYKRLIPSS